MRISDWSSDVCSSDLLARLYLSCFGAARPGGVGEPLAGESDRRSIRWPSPLRLYPDRGTGDSPGQSWKAEELGNMQPGRGFTAVAAVQAEIGRASCRERVCQSG